MQFNVLFINCNYIVNRNRLFINCKSNITKKLASYKIPKKIFYIKELPKNALGKIDYKLLKEYYSTLNINNKMREK